jgi:hypothetical protein
MDRFYKQIKSVVTNFALKQCSLTCIASKVI